VPTHHSWDLGPGFQALQARQQTLQNAYATLTKKIRKARKYGQPEDVLRLIKKKFALLHEAARVMRLLPQKEA
jgi:hypothetical protein